MDSIIAPYHLPFNHYQDMVYELDRNYESILIVPRHLPGFRLPPARPNRPLWDSELWQHLDYLATTASKLAIVHGTSATFSIIDVLRLFEAADWTCIETGIVHSSETPLTIKVINPHGHVKLSNLRPVYRQGSIFKPYPIARPRRFYAVYERDEPAAGRLIEWIEWNGVFHEGWAKAASAAGTNIDALKSRKRKGYKCDADVPAPRNLRRR